MDQQLIEKFNLNICLPDRFFRYPEILALFNISLAGIGAELAEKEENKNIKVLL